MEIALHPKLPSQVILGPRQSNGGGLEQVLVAIVKGTFLAPEPNATPRLVEQQLPIFQKDIFFNWVRNGDFTVGPQVNGQGEVITPVAAWEAQGPSIQVRPDRPDPPEYLEVTGAGRVIQTVGFDRPLAGRTYRFSFKARSSVPTTVRGIRVETRSGVVGLESDFSFSDEFPVYPYESPAITWPATTEDTEATIVLRGSDDPGVTVDYDQVALAEGTTPFSFDPDDPIWYEHDLATYKPYADIVVLGQPAPPDPYPDGDTWTETVAMNDTEMIGVFNEGGGLASLRFEIDGTLYSEWPDFIPPWSASTPITFGWQSRLLEPEPPNPRNVYAGTYNETEDSWEGFENQFFNGGLYTEEGRPSFSHIPAAATVDIITQAEYADGSGSVETRTDTRTLQVPAWSPTFAITYRMGTKRTARTVRGTPDMRIDTLVYNKETREFYIVWRGVWSYDSVPAERYVQVKLS